MLGGSPHIVAEPPRFAQKISAKNKITVILSINISKIADMIIKTKKPAEAIPSTMIIIPAMNKIVAQLIPEEDLALSDAEYQKSKVKIF